MIINVYGSQGSGKTLFLIKKGLEAFRNKREIYTNITSIKYPRKICTFEELMKCKLNNCLILLDEAHLWGLDARDFMGKKNKALVKQFIPQLRKQGTDLITSTQFPRQLDVRVKENSDYIVWVRKYLFDKKRKKLLNTVQSQFYDPKAPIVVECNWVSRDTMKEYKSYFIANKYYDFYNTREVIGMVKDEEKKIEKNNKEKIEKKKNL